ncbi:MAG: hypothetical protein LIP23_07900, partial [Planctomycetes bacterium]|nr:hypothetical protein [Planctomycetota bacterium]
MFRQLPFKIAVASFLLLALARLDCHAGETAHPWDNKRIYYIIEYMGRLRERGFFVRHPGSFQRRPCVITEEEKQSYAEYDSETLILTARIKSITTPTGEALQRHEEALFGDTGYETIAIASGEADFLATGFYGRPIRIPVPNGAVFEVSGEWLAAQNPQVGKKVMIDLIDRISRGVSREEVTFEQRIAAATDTSPAVWLAVFRTENRPPLYARFTSDGRLLRLDSEGLTYQIVTRDDYIRGRIPSGNEPMLDPPAEYPRFDQLAGQPATIQPGGFEPLPEPQPYVPQPAGMVGATYP